MNENFVQLGARIREMREICDFNVSEVAKYVGVSADIYEEYEKCGENIPISVLYALSNKFGVDLNELLTGRAPHLLDYCVVKNGMGAKIERYPGYSFKSLANRFRNKIMEPLLVTVEKSDADPKLVEHLGQEFNLVIEGKIELLFKDKRIVLEAGDSIYFNATYPHGQKAIDCEKAVFLTVIAE